MTTPEFHDELYGFIQEQAIKEDEECYMPKEFDKYLLAKNPNLTQIKTTNILNRTILFLEYNTTIATYIRNVIHHPENPHNERPTPDDFKVSSPELLKILRTPVSNSILSESKPSPEVVCFIHSSSIVMP